MDQQSVVYPYNGIILDDVTELTTNIHDIIAEWKYAEWKKSEQKVFLLFHSYEIPKQAKTDVWGQKSEQWLPMGGRGYLGEGRDNFLGWW